MLRVVQAAPRLPRPGAAGAAEPGRRSPAGRGHGAGPGCGRLKGAFVAVPAFPEPEVRAGLEGAYCRRAGPGRAGCIPTPPSHAGPPPRAGQPRDRAPHSRPRCPTAPGSGFVARGTGGHRGTEGRRDLAGCWGGWERPPSPAPPIGTVRAPPRCPPQLVGPPPPCPCRALLSAAWELRASCPALAGAEPPPVLLQDVGLVLLGCTPQLCPVPPPPTVRLISHSHGQGEGDTRHRPVPFPPDCPGSPAGPWGTLTFNLHHF